MKVPIVIAEIGCTHIGKIERAKYLAKLAKESGANILKTQKRNPYESVKKELWDKPHPNQMYAYGKTYLEHRLNLELPLEQHKELKNYCEEIGIEYSTSVWDITSAKEIETLHPNKIKIPSACNLNFDLIQYCLDHFSEVHISNGMTTFVQRYKLYKYLDNYKDSIVIYACTSGYPVPFEHLYLNEIKELSGRYPRVGYSHHGYGIAAPAIAYVLNANYIEVHFTDDRLFRHTDSSSSLEKTGLTKLCRDLHNICKSLQNKPDELCDIEKEQNDKLRI